MGAKFQRVKDFQTSRDYTTLEPFLHEDYLYLREEGLQTREDFLTYLRDATEGEDGYKTIDIKLLFENNSSVVYQILCDFLGPIGKKQRVLITFHEIYKNEKSWRVMSLAEPVGLDFTKIPHRGNT